MYVRSFDASEFQAVNKPYAPMRVQFFVGDDNESWAYKSPEFEYNRDTFLPQYFSVEPHVMIGKFLKVLLIGKVKRQQMDNKYYHAIAYVGCNATKVSDALSQLRVEQKERPIQSYEAVKKALSLSDQDFFFAERRSVMHHSATLLSEEDSAVTAM